MKAVILELETNKVDITQSDADRKLSQYFLYDANPKLKYINVPHGIISWLEISWNNQPIL